MQADEDHYYTINKQFLKALGIWPHDKSRLVILQRVLITLVLMSHIGTQLSVLVTTECNMALFIRIMSLSVFFIILAGHYYIFLFKAKDIINLHYQIREDWKLMRDKVECDIIRQNAHDGHIFIRLLFLCFGFLCVHVIVIQFLPIILDVVSPLDKPRPRNLLIMAEYYIFQNDYFYSKALHELVSFTISCLIGCATGTQLLGFVFHSFGMFKITRYRIQYSIEECVMHASKSQMDRAICKRVMHATLAHRRTLEYTNSVVASFEKPLSIIGFFGVLTLSINLYGVVEATAISRNLENFILCFICLTITLVYIFIANFIGQEITDWNSSLSIYVYNTSWYLMPVSSQKLMLFLIRYFGKEFAIIYGVMFTAKLDSFSWIINAALSYATVLYNCQIK